MFSGKLSTLQLFALSFVLVCSFGFQTAYGDADFEQTFKTKTIEIATAYTKNDTEFLAGVYADNFLMTAQSHHVVTKEQLLENQRFEEGTTFEIADWRAIRLGDTVVVLYKQTWNYSDGGSNKVAFTDVWVKKDEDWSILTSHATQISLK